MEKLNILGTGHASGNYLENRKMLYTGEEKSYFRDNIYVPDD